MGKPFTYTSQVREGAGGSRHWATSEVDGGAWAGVRFCGDGRQVDVATPDAGMFVDMWIASNGQRVAAVKAWHGGETLLVKEDGTILTLPASAGVRGHRFGPGDRLYIQQDNSGKVYVYGFDGRPVMVSSAAIEPGVIVQMIPLAYEMPYDAGSGIHAIASDGSPVPGIYFRAESTVDGVALSFPERSGDWVVGQASVGLLGGAALVNVATGAKTMWPVSSDMPPRLTVIDDVPYVSISQASPAPRPDDVEAWPAYDPLPPDVVDGTRRDVYLVAVSDGVTQAPGHLHWSHTDGSKPHVEGGAYAWRDYFEGHPPAVIWHDTRDDVEAKQEYPINWPTPPAEHITGEEHDANGVARKRFVGSMKELAILTGAILVLYHDANKAEADIAYGENREQPDTDSLGMEHYTGIQRVIEFNRQGIPTLIGHQGYPYVERRQDGTYVRYDAKDALWRTERWGLELYARAGIGVMLTIPIWTGNPLPPDGAPAYPIRDVAELFHFQTALVDRYPCVEIVMAFDWNRAGGQKDHPWIGRAWSKRVTSTAPGALRLPAPRGYTPPVVVPAPVEPTPPAPVKPPASHGPSSHTTAIVVGTAASVAAAVAAVKLIEYFRAKAKAGEIKGLTLAQYDAVIDEARKPVAEGIAIAERELAAGTPPPAPRLSRALAARARRPKP